jgi:hypothetical protein
VFYKMRKKQKHRYDHARADGPMVEVLTRLQKDSCSGIVSTFYPIAD